MNVVVKEAIAYAASRKGINITKKLLQALSKNSYTNGLK